MQNNVNTFNAAKVTEAFGSLQGTDQQRLDTLQRDFTILQKKHNYLLDILSKQIQILKADIANGITVDTTGTVQLGLASSTTSGALSSTDWGTFNGKQDHSNELDAIAVLSDAPGLMKKTGDGTYSMLEGTAENDFILAGADFSWTVKTLAQVQALIGPSTTSSIWGYL